MELKFYTYHLDTIYGSYRTAPPFDPPTQNTITIICFSSVQKKFVLCVKIFSCGLQIDCFIRVLQSSENFHVRNFSYDFAYQI